MKKRIQELAEQAFEPINAVSSEGVADRYTFDQEWFRLYNEKFAKLLIDEAIEVMVKHDYHGEWLGGKIKEHFGVGE